MKIKKIVSKSQKKIVLFNFGARCNIVCGVVCDALLPRAWLQSPNSRQGEHCVGYYKKISPNKGGVRYSSSKRRFSVGSSLRRISSSFGCGNETVLRQYCRRDLEASNLRSALEQGCGRHTTSAAILFFHKNLVYVLEIKT